MAAPKPDYKVFRTLKEAQDFIQKYEKESLSRFVYNNSMPNFGKEWTHTPGTFPKMIHWKAKTIGGLHDLGDGLPHIYMGRKYLGCYLGRDKSLSKEVVARKERMRKLLGRHDKRYQSSKVDCPARICINHIVTFPEFKVADESSCSEELAKTQLRHAFSHNIDIVAESYFCVNMSMADKHEKHAITPPVPLVHPRLYPPIKEKLQELFDLGLTKLKDLRREVASFMASHVDVSQIDKIHFRWNINKGDVRAMKLKLRDRPKKLKRLQDLEEGKAKKKQPKPMQRSKTKTSRSRGVGPATTSTYDCGLENNAMDITELSFEKCARDLMESARRLEQNFGCHIFVEIKRQEDEPAFVYDSRKPEEALNTQTTPAGRGRKKKGKKYTGKILNVNAPTVPVDFFARIRNNTPSLTSTDLNGAASAQTANTSTPSSSFILSSQLSSLSKRRPTTVENIRKRLAMEVHNKSMASKFPKTSALLNSSIQPAALKSFVNTSSDKLSPLIQPVESLTPIAIPPLGPFVTPGKNDTAVKSPEVQTSVASRPASPDSTVEMILSSAEKVSSVSPSTLQEMTSGSSGMTCHLSVPTSAVVTTQITASQLSCHKLQTSPAESSAMAPNLISPETSHLSNSSSTVLGSVSLSTSSSTASSSSTTTTSSSSTTTSSLSPLTPPVHIKPTTMQALKGLFPVDLSKGKTTIIIGSAKRKS